MNKSSMYDQFGENYDRFVNWEARLALEVPFLTSVISSQKSISGGVVSVLDTACATGHHAIALAKLGFNVTGADISSEMITIACGNSKQANVNISFEQVGFGQLVDAFSENAFDAVLCLGNSLPHVLDEKSLFNTLLDFHKVLQPGGWLIIQNQNYDKIMDNRTRWLDPQTFREDDSTWIFSRFYDFHEDGLITFNIVILTNKGKKEFEQQVISTQLWPMKKDRLEYFLNRLGFRELEFYGDLSGSPLNLIESSNLVIVARKA